MASIDTLRQRQQVHILRKAALRILPRYGIEPVRVALCLNLMNTTFRVFTREGAEYVLRIHPLIGYDSDTIQGEMEYLALFSRESGLRAPVPQQTTAGEFVVRETLDGSTETRNAVLMSWMDGRFSNQRMSERQLRLTGEYIARMHLFSIQNAARLAGIYRPRFNFEGFFGPGAMFDPGEGIQHLTVEAREVTHAAAEKIRRAMEALGEGPDVFGFMHGDFYYRNLLFKNGEAAAIDFDLCGPGYYLYDLAVPYWPPRQGDVVEANRLVLEGYRSVRSVANDELEYLKDFLAQRRLIDIYYGVRRFELFKSWLPGAIQKIIPELKRYVQGEV